MARFGFRTLSGGAGPLSYTNIYIAFTAENTCERGKKLYRFGNFFNYTTTVALGYSMSAVDGGVYLPSVDTSGRTLPTTWGGRRLRLEVAGSHLPAARIRTECKITLSRYDAARREITLYEDTISFAVNGTNVGGINVEGDLEVCPLSHWNNEDVYDGIMHPFDW